MSVSFSLFKWLVLRANSRLGIIHKRLVFEAKPFALLKLDHLRMGNRTLHLLDSSPTGFHIVYALIQLHNVQEELCDHYWYGSRMNSWICILVVTVGEVCSRRTAQDVGEVSIILRMHLIHFSRSTPGKKGMKGATFGVI